MYSCVVCVLIVATVAFLPYVSAYPVRKGRFQTTSTGTCASIGYTTGCCPPDEDCQATDSGAVDCFCDYKCHLFGDCCTDIVSVCPSNPTTCTELGFTDRCCQDDDNDGICEIQSNGAECSCQLSCHLNNNCCSDVGCLPRTCTEAGLDAGCCEGNCTVYRDDADVCYCDKDCSEQGDCCDDVDQQKQCPPSECTLTIAVPGNRQSKTQQTHPRPILSPSKLLDRYQQRMKSFAGTAQARMLPATRRAYVDQQSMLRNRLSNIMFESRPYPAQVRKKTRS